MKPHLKAADGYLPYDVLTKIPAQILQARDTEQSYTTQDARLVHDALLFNFMLTLPCLCPKQIRDARICGTPNVFKGPFNPFGDIAVPEWAADVLRRNPYAVFWQVHFSKKETAGREVRTALPQDLIPMLEEYLAQHRPLLVGDKDPGTIFVGKRGGPLSARNLTGLIGNLTARFAGCRILPAWIRLAFAFCFLGENPHDYLTLSCVLGHADVRSNTSMFGTRTYVSGAMRTVEAWAKNRKRKSDDRFGGKKN